LRADTLAAPAADKLIDGAALAARVQGEVARRVAALSVKHIAAGLTVVLVGDDPASAVYVGAKERTCIELGMKGETIRLPASTSQAELVAIIDRLNADSTVHGILVQMPLPRGIDPDAIVRRIRPEKDVDGFHPVNVGKLLIGERDGFAPCTPSGVLYMLQAYNVPTAGADCVIIGRSNIVGKPMAALMVQPGVDSTVTVCHSRTRDLAAHTRRADILIVAAGRPEMVTADMVKKYSVVIDVGMNRTEAGLVGDVDPGALERAAFMTPVPGGVGPMTIACLLRNTLISAHRRAGVAYDKSAI